MLSVDEYLKAKNIKDPQLKKSYDLLLSYELTHKKFSKADFLNELYIFCTTLKQNRFLKERYIQAFFLINEIEKNLKSELERKNNEKTPNI